MRLATKRASTSRLSSSTESGTTRPNPHRTKVGYVRRAHGVRGAVIVNPLTDDPARFDTGAEFHTDNPGLPEVVLETVQPHKDGLLATLSGVADRDQAESLRGTSLFVDASQRRTLEPDEFWPDQLVGMVALDPAGNALGTVVDVIDGPQDRLAVETSGGVFEVPFVAAIVTEVDVVAKQLVIDAPDGLIPN